ncbi:GNAT family N-acetyltransferase [Oscillatoria acuminata]|uniref:Acetyltransferase n=1 Tax=Oscillatoria acuminata PCC 6304 TaxID=56110 RepID=K9TIL9_9CYAN|nr:GNAT family N-acetyltransferase [Oscillatoria acuminata]AFY81859.1 acetyltransferase [Oscillatoria acuminata PCC 6304]
MSSIQNSNEKRVGPEIQTKRLTDGDRKLAKKLFTLMAEVFAEESEPLSDDYLDSLLNRADFWAIAAFVDHDIVGGITAHTLPMIRSESSEVFIYDIAVRKDHQRQGIGRHLMTVLCESVATVGIRDLFVCADNEDIHALDFYQALGGVPSPVTLFTFSADEV